MSYFASVSTIILVGVNSPNLNNWEMIEGESPLTIATFSVNLVTGKPLVFTATFQKTILGNVSPFMANSSFQCWKFVFPLEALSNSISLTITMYSGQSSLSAPNVAFKTSANALSMLVDVPQCALEIPFNLSEIFLPFTATNCGVSAKVIKISLNAPLFLSAVYSAKATDE